MSSAIDLLSARYAPGGTSIIMEQVLVQYHEYMGIPSIVVSEIISQVLAVGVDWCMLLLPKQRYKWEHNEVYVSYFESWIQDVCYLKIIWKNVWYL